MGYSGWPAWTLQRIKMRLIRMRMQQGRPRGFEAYLPYIQGKSGLEIGGPSGVFKESGPIPIYEEIGSLDNCDFSKSTVWAQHAEAFVFSPGKTHGNTFFCEGSALCDLPDSTYDFILSSHNLEHFANPVKALREWQRVLRSNGALILVLPYYRVTFDHRRKLTSVSHMLDDFKQNTQEDDLTHLPEILEKHDLRLDPGAGSKQDFHRRCLENFSNRCIHHHVFDEQNSSELLSKVGFKVLKVDLVLDIHNVHICILATL